MQATESQITIQTENVSKPMLLPNIPHISRFDQFKVRHKVGPQLLPVEVLLLRVLESPHEEELVEPTTAPLTYTYLIKFCNDEFILLIVYDVNTI